MYNFFAKVCSSVYDVVLGVGITKGTYCVDDTQEDDQPSVGNQNQNYGESTEANKSTYSSGLKDANKSTYSSGLKDVDVSDGNQESQDQRISDTKTVEKLDEKEKISDSDEPNRKTFHGEITSLYSGRGLIDDHIFFSQDIVVGNTRLKVGTKVVVEASRTNSQGGWVATKVTVFKEWGVDSEETETVTEIIGMVTYARGVSGLVNDKYSFTKAHCLGNYHALVNDFVKCELRTFGKGDTDGEIISVKPLREIQFVGMVTEAMNYFGFVDEDIYFPFGACKPGSYRPRKGDWVLVTAMESKAKKSHWRGSVIERATEDMKTQFGDSSHFKSLSSSEAQNLGDSRMRLRSRANNVNRSNRENNMVLPGQRPTRKKRMFLPKHLKNYELPNDIKECILSDGHLVDLIPDVALPLSMENHKSKLGALLYVEEIALNEEMRQFDMERVTLRVVKEFLSLRVPGLAEGRPSLLIGDRVIVDISDSPDDAPRYEGCVHEVRAEDVLLKFSDSFHKIYRNEDCDVQFFFNRSTIRKCHQAVEYAADLGEEVLFPSVLKSKPPAIKNANEFKKKGLDFFNKNLNERQQSAVKRILAGQCRPIPYLLFGPPGTGKTVTLVESILQIHKAIPHCRILACAPSNSASDLIAQRLVEHREFSTGELIRLNALQRSQDVPESIKPFCTSDTDAIMLTCRYRIIVSTCSMAGILYCAGLQSDHFTHVFIDEAGQATEPESLIAAGMLAGNDEGQVVLAGDPHQLGPVLQSNVALHFGLDISLLERLISRPLYERNKDAFAEHGCYNPLLVTKLINNYRSHDLLLNISSSIFYHSELLSSASSELKNSFIDAQFLPNKEFPLIFHGVRGEDRREGNSPSWFNPAETVQVIHYVQKVMATPNQEISLQDIGIITPYRKQVEKIRLLLDRVNMKGIKVGSVEEFQGQERKIIIISTVRSNESFVTFDKRHALGFLCNPKRFNVAITRAQSLLIVIGNPHILCRDPYWCALIQYCVMHCAHIGCELPSLNDPMIKENFSVALKMLGIGVDGVEECKGIICENDNDPRHNTINIAAASNGTTRSNGVLNGDDHLVTKFRRASLIPEEEDPDDSWH